MVTVPAIGKLLAIDQKSRGLSLYNYGYFTFVAFSASSMESRIDGYFLRDNADKTRGAARVRYHLKRVVVLTAIRHQHVNF
jgi:hypothetical protein